MNRIFIVICLLLGLYSASAQQIWHRTDSSIIFPSVDSISPTEEYTIVAAFRSLNPDSLQLLWGISSDDTLRSAFLTNGSFRQRGGVFRSQQERDYSKWCVCYYHTGCQMDSTQTHQLWLGPTRVYPLGSMCHSDLLSANVEIRELLYTPSHLTRVEKAAWQSYMAMKHGITLDYVPYISPVGDTLWHHEEDADYYHRVVAIGTDSAHAWVSTSSASLENATLAIRVFDMLAEGEYILLGDNGMEEALSMAPNNYDCLLRTWRLRSHTQNSQGCSFAWTPTMPIAFPDSVWLDVRDPFDNIIHSFLTDSIGGDTTWFFTLPSLLPTQTLSIRTISSGAVTPSPAEATYNASSGTISLPMLDPEKVYSYALYTNLGQLLFWPASSRPDCILVGALPTGIYRIEAFENSQMITSVPVIVH